MGAAAEGNDNRSIRLVRDALGHSHCPTGNGQGGGRMDTQAVAASELQAADHLS